jgi:hypothetical protein
VTNAETILAWESGRNTKGSIGTPAAKKIRDWHPQRLFPRIRRRLRRGVEREQKAAERRPVVFHRAGERGALLGR